MEARCFLQLEFGKLDIPGGPQQYNRPGRANQIGFRFCEQRTVFPRRVLSGDDLFAKRARVLAIEGLHNRFRDRSVLRVFHQVLTGNRLCAAQCAPIERKRHDEENAPEPETREGKSVSRLQPDAGNLPNDGNQSAETLGFQWRQPMQFRAASVIVAHAMVGHWLRVFLQGFSFAQRQSPGVLAIRAARARPRQGKCADAQ